MKFHYVYQIENVLNGHIYVGKHSTDDISDGYMGSGRRISSAISKYGLENFRKTILKEFCSEEEALEFEASIVTEEFLARTDVYNLNVGGSGSWHAANGMDPDRRLEKNQRAGRTTLKKLWDDPAFREASVRRGGSTLRRLHAEGKIKAPDWTGRRHKKESIEKISQSMVGKQVGSKNSQFGKVWISHEDLRVSKKIDRQELNVHLEEGWALGRKMRW